MKFVYEYRTSDNVRHEDVVIASSREAAFQLLKNRGIKPSRVIEASGFFNKLFGKGKRWIAIAILGILVIGLLLVVFNLRSEIEASHFEGEWEDRSQIYGDPVVLSVVFSNDFKDVFESAGERFLARYAIPGKIVKLTPREMKEGLHALESMSMDMVATAEEDFVEVVKLKRIVNGMKLELGNYLKAGGTIKQYVKRLQGRQYDEYMTYRRIKTELERERDLEVWKNRNLELRVLGLPMVEMGVEEDHKNRY